MNKVIVHCKLSALTTLQELGLEYVKIADELDVIVDNIDALNDFEFVEHYGINYDQVNCIELA